jgi:phospholipase C
VAVGPSQPRLNDSRAYNEQVVTRAARRGKSLASVAPLAALSLLAACTGGSGPQADASPILSRGGDNIYRVSHVIIVMMENHSFDNYFGALAYAPGSPYHASAAGCAEGDHECVDGLSCGIDATGSLACANSNQEDDGSRVAAFHEPTRCVSPDLAHSWLQSHLEANFNDPNGTLLASPNDGFVRVNDTTEQPDNGLESATEDQTIGFYTQDDLPFYYELAQKFAIDDRYFSSVLGPTLPNRMYLMAATSFGHVTTGDPIPPGGFKPITGTIFDLLDSRAVSWADYAQSGPQASLFRQQNGTGMDAHFPTLETFMAQAEGQPGAGELPQVSLVDPRFGGPEENDEHPPSDIQRGQAFVSQIVNAVRNGPDWKDSVIFITYDEHGGFYDHVIPPQARQANSRTPDGIFPGQCADLSNPPASQQAAGGAGCASISDAESLCPALADNPGGPYPASCASFDQLGFRVPLVVVSPFAKPHYVSHATADHASLLAFIERRFLSGSPAQGSAHLTRRDQYADDLEDLFDFDNAPSLYTTVGQAQAPLADCTPLG